MEGLKKTTYRDYSERMLKVLEYIQGHLDDEVSLGELADIACFSAYHFHRIFRGMAGESVKGHIRRLRLERAAQRLKNTTRSVIDIALEAGYEAHESFTRAFGDMFGMSPSSYRDSYRNVNSQSYKADVKAGGLSGFKTEGKDMKVEIIKMEPVMVAYVRHVGPYNQCGRAWDKLCTWAGPRGLLSPGCRFMGLSYDDPDVTPAEKIRYDACITVETDVQPEGEIGVQQLEGGFYAMTTLIGPYEGLSELYSKLCGQWLPANGYEIASKPSIEIYHNSPEDTEPEDLITDIHVPLEAV